LYLGTGPGALPFPRTTSRRRTGSRDQDFVGLRKALRQFEANSHDPPSATIGGRARREADSFAPTFLDVIGPGCSNSTLRLAGLNSPAGYLIAKRWLPLDKPARGLVEENRTWVLSHNCFRLMIRIIRGPALKDEVLR
jgi:hypothetical protein